MPGERVEPEHYDASYQYFRRRQREHSPLVYEWWASRFAAHLVRRYHRSGRVLDIGCGLGHTLRLLEEDFDTYGIEVSPFAVGRARTVASKSRIAHMDVSELSVDEPAYYDAILAMNVLEHLAEPAATIHTCARLLRPRGTLIFLVPNTSSVSRRWKGQDWFGFRDPGHISLYPPETWIALTKESGLQVRRVFGDGLWDVPYLPMIPTFIQRIFLFLPTMLQFACGYPFVPPPLGESLGVIATK
ncbi:MAG: class I SAM-dependent methyltransferase [Anaerolineae bacterium]|nr:class I SAM-dependent methyltransferase [Anaerolineae bacterium]